MNYDYYDYIVSRLRADQVEKALKKFGLEGWRVVTVSVDFGKTADYWSVVMERPLEKLVSTPLSGVRVSMGQGN